MKTFDIFGVPVASTSVQEVLNMIRIKIQSPKPKAQIQPLFIATVNPEFVMEAQGNPEFLQVLQQTDLNVADGNGLRLAGYDGEIFPGRKLVTLLLQEDYRIFFLGGRGGVAKDMSIKYRISNDENLNNENWDEGSGDIKFQILHPKKQTGFNNQLIKKINTYKPDVLLVAYGAPWQEMWIAQNLRRLKVRVVIGVGGTFDYLTGRAIAPPTVVSKFGFEWAWRLVREPWRWRRQLRLIPYMGMCVKQRLTS